MEFSGDHISCFYLPYPKVKNATVIISWECPGISSAALLDLKNQIVSDSKDLYMTAICLATANYIERAVCGDPAKMAAKKSTGFFTSVYGNMFSLRFNTQNTLAAVERTIAAVLQKFNPASAASIASTLLQQCGQTADDAKSVMVNNLLGSVASGGFYVFISGSFRTTATKDGKEYDKWPVMCKKLDGKVDDDAAAKEKKLNATPLEYPGAVVPFENKRRVVPLKPQNIASALANMSTWHYLYATQGVKPIFRSGSFNLYGMTPAKLESLKQKANIQAFVDRIYGKFSDDPTPVLVTFASVFDILDAKSLSHLAGQKITLKSICDAIGSIMK